MLSTLVSLALFSNKTAFNKEIKYALGCCYFKFESEVIDTPMQSPPACDFIKKRLWHRCFPVNFAKFLRTPFLYRTPLVVASLF